ncbi:hypothetical protein CWD85_21640 [Burkholderia pseudomallei]|nr:hypothetical protein CWD85_21640 [Burkholderia pseudomallei]
MTGGREFRRRRAKRLRSSGDESRRPDALSVHRALRVSERGFMVFLSGHGVVFVMPDRAGRRRSPAAGI